MRDLERRYTRLVRLFYPAGYHSERGTEIIGTCLELAGPDQRWPSAADVADLAGGGLSERVRATAATNLIPGLRLAGPLALLAATVLAAGWLVLELRPLPRDFVPGLGHFSSLGVGIWPGWLLAAAVHLVAPGRWARLAVGSMVVLTVAVIPFATVTGLMRPPLYALLPQIALGVVAVAGIGPASRALRLLPLAAGAATVAAMLTVLEREALYFFPTHYYGYQATQAPYAAGIGLLVLALVLGVGLAVRGDHRGGWALLVLLGPIGLLCQRPLAAEVERAVHGSGNPTWPAQVAVAVAIAAGYPVLIALALTVSRRLARGTESADHRNPVA